MLVFANGSGAGTFSGDIPVNYVFNISESNVEGPVNWTLVFAINEIYTQTFRGDGTGLFSGGASITGPLTETEAFSWSISLDVVAQGFWTDSVMLDIPAGQTLNLNQNQIVAAATPEPGSFIVMGSGLAALVAWIRRRKKS